VGGYFGGRLAEANRDVTFLVRVRRAEEIKEKGLQIVSPHGDLTLHPKAVTADQIQGSYDVILLGVKSHALESAINDFASAVGPDTMILPVLNGMRHMDQLAARFGAHAVLGGVCIIATEIDLEGRTRQLADVQSLANRTAGARRACVNSTKRFVALVSIVCSPATSCRTCGKNGCSSQPWEQ
jgi:2-dehydropantoate 2-reductase